MGDYYIGLDIGTNSVGWAVLDENYNLIRLKGKTAWGVRIFDEANTAKNRRDFRQNRRRLQRRKYRIKLLNDIFDKSLAEVDSTFLRRLDESMLIESDKSDLLGKHLIYKNAEEEIKFFEKYKTIYHLRYALMQNKNDEAKDIKYIYLAIRHILKHRGNFLRPGNINFKNIDDETLEQLNEFFLSLTDEGEEKPTFVFDDKVMSKIVKILLDRNLNKKSQQKEIKNLIKSNCEDYFDNDIAKQFLDLFVTFITGGEYSLSNLDYFKENGIESDIKKVSISLFNNEDKKEELENLFGAENCVILNLGKAIYDFVYVKECIGDAECFSEAMINVYNEHANDLKLIKKYFKKTKKYKEYKDFFENAFINKGIENYAYYVEHNSLDDHDYLINYLKQLIKLDDVIFLQSDEFKKLKEKIEKSSDKLLRTINNTKNSKFPMQFHRKELEVILENASNYHDFIKENKDKILAIFDYKLKYYEGPTNTQSPFTTIVKKTGYENYKLYPWNKDEIIDIKETKNKFIKVRTNHCTEILEEYVLPKMSILYSDYIILDKINCLRINSKKIDHETKLKLFEFICNNEKTNITINSIKKFLCDRFPNVYGQDGATLSLEGMDTLTDIKNPIRPLLKDVFNLNDRKVFDALEKSIEYLTIFADEKESAIDSIQREFRSRDINLSEFQLKTLKKLSCKGWGRFSNKLLRGIKSVDDNGVVLSIYDYLLEKEENFQQIYYKYGFKNQVDDLNDNYLNDKEGAEDYLMDNLPAPFRRAVIQSLKIVDEIIWANKKKEPKGIIIEFTRENQESKVTVSRIDEIKTFLNQFIKDRDDILKNKSLIELEDTYDVKLSTLLEEVNKCTSKIKSKAVYLYFKQLGLDPYTGENIKLEDLFNGDKYDIDHIFPRHLGGENVLENMVLTDKEKNQSIKGKRYPIPEQIRCNPSVRKLWSLLKSKGLLSETKYSTLISDQEVTEEDAIKFTKDQLTRASYQNKEVAKILEVKYNKRIKIYFGKAKESSAIRQNLSIAKIRELNDAHHAIDAYLIAVSSLILNDKIYNTQNEYLIAKKIHNMYKEINGDDDKFTLNKESALMYYIESQKLKEKIINTCYRHDVLISIREKYSDGTFYNQNPVKKGDRSLAPIHTSFKRTDAEKIYLDPAKYGGYDSLSISFYAVAKNNAEKKKIIGVPILYFVQTTGNVYKHPQQLKDNEKEKLNKILIEKKYLPDKYNINFDSILLPYSVVTYNHNIYVLSPKDASTINLRPISFLYLNQEDSSYLKSIYSFIKTKRYKNYVLPIDEEQYDESELKFYTDRKSTNEIYFSKERNKKLLDSIIKYVRKTCLKNDFVLLKKIPDLDDYIKQFEQEKLFKQFDLILDFVDYFNRTRDKDSRKRISSLASDLSIIRTNYTGLVKKVIKL